MGAKSGNQRSNKSWVIGRLLRDHEHFASKSKFNPHKVPGSHEALRVTVFEVAKSPAPGVIARDWVYYSGFAVMVAQFVVAAIPLILNRNWTILMVVGVGTILALLQGAMPQWRKEKWASPKRGGYTVSITQGNGSRHVMVILADEYSGLDLEILAAGGMNLTMSRLESAYVSLLTACWTILLISVAGLSDDSWCKCNQFEYSVIWLTYQHHADLLGIGLMGIVHNVFAAGTPRSAGALGIHLEEKEVISSDKVAEVLYETESKYPLVGSSLVPIFFSGGMRVSEERKQFWDGAEKMRLNIGLDQLRIRKDVKADDIRG